jgi:hypothetical protein
MPASEAERAEGRTTKSAAPGAEVKATVKVRKPGKVKAPKAQTTKVTKARVTKAGKDLRGAKAAAAVGSRGPTDAELRAIEQGKAVESNFQKAVMSGDADERALSAGEKKARAAEMKPPSEVKPEGYRLKAKRPSLAGAPTEAELSRAAALKPTPAAEAAARQSKIAQFMKERGATKLPSSTDLFELERQFLRGEITEAQYKAGKQGTRIGGVGTQARERAKPRTRRAPGLRLGSTEATEALKQARKVARKAR